MYSQGDLLDFLNEATHVLIWDLKFGAGEVAEGLTLLCLKTYF